MKVIIFALLLLVCMIAASFPIAKVISDDRYDVDRTNKATIDYPDIEKAKIGDTVIFGHFEQDGNLQNGEEAIAWRFLDVKKDSILVISEKNLWCLGLDGGNP